MSVYTATIHWQHDEGDFLGNSYSRAHTWHFDGGLEVPASSSPSIVKIPWSVAENIDPEEAFVASLSSCHMLWFLSIAAAKKFAVTNYTDKATGTLSTNASGKQSITRVELNPVVNFNQQASPSCDELNVLHHLAHQKCFIANSVTSDIVINPQAEIGIN